MKKVILTSILTVLSASVASASPDCPDLKLVKAVVAQIDKYNPNWSITETTGSADITIELDDTRPYSCQRNGNEIVVSSKKDGKDFVIGMLKIHNGQVEKLRIDTITIDTAGSGTLKLNLENPQTPFVGIDLRNNALILRDGRLIAP